jgi:hypothetical protein
MVRYTSCHFIGDTLILLHDSKFSDFSNYQASFAYLNDFMSIYQKYIKLELKLFDILVLKIPKIFLGNQVVVI